MKPHRGRSDKASERGTKGDTVTKTRRKGRSPPWGQKPGGEAVQAESDPVNRRPLTLPLMLPGSDNLRRLHQHQCVCIQNRTVRASCFFSFFPSFCLSLKGRLFPPGFLPLGNGEEKTLLKKYKSPLGIKSSFPSNFTYP